MIPQEILKSKTTPFSIIKETNNDLVNDSINKGLDKKAKLTILARTIEDNPFTSSHSHKDLNGSGDGFVINYIIMHKLNAFTRLQTLQHQSSST